MKINKEYILEILHSSFFPTSWFPVRGNSYNQFFMYPCRRYFAYMKANTKILFTFILVVAEYD